MDALSVPNSRRAMWILAAATLVGCGLRLLWVLKFHPPGQFIWSDMLSYVDRAKELRQWRYSEWDWLYPPGAPMWITLGMLIAPKHWEIAAALIQALLSTVEIPLVYVAARRWFGTRVALASAIVFALSYFSISYTGDFLSENYITFGLIISMALFDPDRAVRGGLAGVALGYSALVKPQAIFLAPFWGFALLRRRQFKTFAALALGSLLVVGPACYVASRAVHHFTFISSAGGVVMTQAWCPVRDVNSHYGGGKAGFGIPAIGQRGMRGEEEATWGHAHFRASLLDSNFYLHEGLKCIARFPKASARRFFYNIADTLAGTPWSYQGPWPDAFTDWRKPTIGWNLFVSWILFPLACVGMWRERRNTGMVYLVFLPLLSCFVNCAIFHGEPRFRLPYDFLIFIAASAAVIGLWESRRGVARPSDEQPLAAPLKPALPAPTLEDPVASATSTDPEQRGDEPA